MSGEEINVLRIVLVSRDSKVFEDMATALKKCEDMNLNQTNSGEKALALISGSAFDLVVADDDLGDMTGLELVRRILRIDFRVNFAVVSELSPDEFHEASEGLGILAQLPRRPGRKDAERVIKTLKQIKGTL